MAISENAEMSYEPDDGTKADPDKLEVALAQAERQLAHRKGIKGVGITKTSSGKDAIVVYGEDQQALSQLPESVDGFPLIGEVTGEIGAL